VNGFSLIEELNLEFGIWDSGVFLILELLIPHNAVPFFYFICALLWLALVLAVSTFDFSMGG
jgi:hypothetical protein